MKQILVPTDFSEIASNACKYALALAEIMGSDIIIYHADQHDEMDLIKLQKEVLESTLNKPFIKIDYVSTHKQFSSLNLEEVIKEHRVDLIILGTSGEKADFKKKLFDRNSDDVAEHVNCPVLVIPPDFTFTKINTIAYASDLNFIDKEILPVVSLAKLLNASIEVFHISPIYPDLGDIETMNVSVKIENIKATVPNLKISYSVVTTDGDNEFIEGLSEFIATHSADILVMYHNHLSAFDEFFTNSNTSKVIAHLEMPLFVYPKL